MYDQVVNRMPDCAKGLSIYKDIYYEKIKPAISV